LSHHVHTRSLLYSRSVIATIDRDPDPGVSAREDGCVPMTVAFNE
jgi:hypothetical protein